MAFTEQEKEAALKLYDELGSVGQVINKLGYPSRQNMYTWIKNRDIEKKRKKYDCSDEPDSHLVNTMLDDYHHSLGNEIKPMIHSDRGCHYRWPGWIERMKKYGYTRSMSKKGCSPDNSACEGFFGRMKNEMFYGRDFMGVTIAQFIEI